MEKNLPVYRLTINEEDDDTIVNMISIVEDPAIDINYLAFSKDAIISQSFKVENKAKRNLMGPLMVPDTLIYRVDKKTGKEFYVVMDEETIDNSMKKFAKNKFNANINANHSIGIKGGTLIESWKITDPKNDKSDAFGFEGLKKGTWMGVINLDPKPWDDYIANGDLKFGGFSIEGNFLMSTEPIEEEFSKMDKTLLILTDIIYDFLQENNDNTK